MALYDVKTTQRAKDHFRGHIGYIIHRLRNPDAAWKLRDALDEAVMELEDHPETAPFCADPALHAYGYRKKLIPGTRYLCICRIDDDVVWIEGIYHELQDYENLFKTE